MSYKLKVTDNFTIVVLDSVYYMEGYFGQNFGWKCMEILLRGFFMRCCHIFNNFVFYLRVFVFVGLFMFYFEKIKSLIYK